MFTHKEDENNSLEMALFGNPNECHKNQEDIPSGLIQKKSTSSNRSGKGKNAPKKRQLSVKKEDKLNLSKKTGHWGYEENKKYHWFLEIYNSHFVNKQMRRTDKIFKTMEIFLGTREAEQCRSHHQKMEKKYKNFKQILLHLRNYHYGTDDHLALSQDLASNHIQLNNPLIRAEYLHQNNFEDAEINKQENQKQMPAFEPLEEEENRKCFFSDCYEQQMGFNDISP